MGLVIIIIVTQSDENVRREMKGIQIFSSQRRKCIFIVDAHVCSTFYNLR